MATRWEITKAVRASDLPAPSRLVMLVLADVAEVGTAEIPAKWTPSLRVLATETGLDESTVTRHLNSLEEKGWVKRTRPDADAARMLGERTRYQLTLPVGVVAENTDEVAQDSQDHAENNQPTMQRTTSPGCTEQPSKEESDLGQIDRSSSSGEPTKALATVDRLDVEQVCRHLADRIEANGSKRPTVTKRWRDAARLLIDRDGKTKDQIIRAIDWCQDDEFWRGNVLSMPKLRDKYEQLRLAAQRPNGRASPLPTTDRKVEAARQAGREVQAMLEGRRG